MKKFILVAAVIGITTAVYQPTSAQVRINVNIGTPPVYNYQPNYVSQRPVVYVNQNSRNYRNDHYYPKRRVVVYNVQPSHYRSAKYRKAKHYYSGKNVGYDRHQKSSKYFKSNKKGRR